jgi:hypothetical protein
VRGGTYLVPFPSVCHITIGPSSLSTQDTGGGACADEAVGISPCHAQAWGVCFVRTAVVFSPPRTWLPWCGSSEDSGGGYAASAGLHVMWLGFFEGVQAARVAMVISPPRALLLLMYVVSSPLCHSSLWSCTLGGMSSEDGGGSLAALLWGFPGIRQRHRSSEDGSGIRAASADPWLLGLGLFEGVQAATAAVVISPLPIYI